MKKLIALFIATLLSHTIIAQVQSDCTVPQDLATVYKSDIKNLALRRMYQLKTPDTAFISIPQSYQDTIAEGLAAIFNATSIPERDTIFNIFCIHTSSNTGAYLPIVIGIDESYSWTQAWQNLNAITGNSYIDSLVVNYSLTVVSYSASSSYVVLDTELGLNIYALIDSFVQEPGVNWGSPNMMIGGGGQEIRYDKIGEDRYYDFDIGWGDCLAGCINHRIWQFKVSIDCTVEYLGYVNIVSTPDSIPEPTPCNSFPTGIENIQDENISIFPNPTKGVVTIEGVEGKIEIYDTYGRLVKTTQNNTLDISEVARGIYLLKATDEQGRVYSQKIVKE